MKNPKFAAASAALANNAALDAVLDQVDAGLLKIYSGTQPATVATAITDQVLLAVLTLDDPAWDPAAAGSKALGAVTADAAANGTGVAAWCSFCLTNGTRIYEDSAGEAADDCALILDDKNIETGGEVSVTSGVVTCVVA